MTKVGEHITLDIIGTVTVKEYDQSLFEKVIHDIARAAEVTILNISKYKFEPQGFTILALLAESHISFHTFPEKGIISFDFFTCGKVSPSIAIDIIKKEFKYKRIVKKEFNRDTKSLYHDIYSSPGLQKSYVVNDVLEDFNSKVGQHIEILELEQFGKSLFIDGEIQVASSDEHLYSSTFVRAGLNLNKDNDRAAIIGGGDGGVARECMSKKFNFVDWYELDSEVVEVCNKHLGEIGNKSTYVGEVGGPSGNVLREQNYKLGDPSKPTEKEGLAKLIDFSNPFNSSSNSVPSKTAIPFLFFLIILGKLEK